MCYSFAIKNSSQKFYSFSYKKGSVFLTNSRAVQDIRSKTKEITFSSNKKVLDVACGIGLLGKSFSDNVYGFDLNEQAVKVAKKNGVKARIGNVEKKWPYPDKSFDIVIASHIIEHVVNPDHLILEAKRILKKGGLFIVATPNLAAWFNRILLLMGFQPFFTEVSTIDKTLGLKFTRKLTKLRSPLGHLRVFTLKSLKEILALHKLKIVKVEGNQFGSFPLLIGLVDKLISNIVPLASSVIIVSKT